MSTNVKIDSSICELPYTDLVNLVGYVKSTVNSLVESVFAESITKYPNSYIHTKYGCVDDSFAKDTINRLMETFFHHNTANYYNYIGPLGTLSFGENKFNIPDANKLFLLMSNFGFPPPKQPFNSKFTSTRNLLENTISNCFSYPYYEVRGIFQNIQGLSKHYNNNLDMFFDLTFWYLCINNEETSEECLNHVLAEQRLTKPKFRAKLVQRWQRNSGKFFVTATMKNYEDLVKERLKKFGIFLD